MQVPSAYHYASLLQIAAEAVGGVAIGSAIIETAPEYFLAGFDRWQLKLAVWTLQAPPHRPRHRCSRCQQWPNRLRVEAFKLRSLGTPYGSVCSPRRSRRSNQSIAVGKKHRRSCFFPVQALLLHAYAKSSVATHFQRSNLAGVVWC